jgi:hypothetical protein
MAKFFISQDGLTTGRTTTRSDVRSMLRRPLKREERPTPYAIQQTPAGPTVVFDASLSVRTIEQSTRAENGFSRHIFEMAVSTVS